ncbi:type II toxin-antitoxin system prevent-host-death family antitoxin [Frankia sp. CiP1_Cm_nod1]|uniref:type II toxin-antitoxin system prevent-host-death family antitoxin n=1 Tax=Frankia sp. CiP1_Cm_nod1 TaxID=2897160 RepID=UPI002024185E
MRSEPLETAGNHLDQLADEAERTGPIALSRPGRNSVVVVSLEDWQRLEDLASEEETAWWRRDTAERATRGELPGEGEEGPGLDEDEIRHRYAHLLRRDGVA